MKRWVVVLAAVALPAMAQQQPGCSNAPQQSGFSGCEEAYLKHFLDEAKPFQDQLQKLQQEMNNYYALVLSQHPDMQLETPSKAYPLGRLIPNPQPAKAAAKPTEKKK